MFRYFFPYTGNTEQEPQIRFALTRGFAVSGLFLGVLPRAALADSLALGYYRPPLPGLSVSGYRRQLEIIFRWLVTTNERFGSWSQCNHAKDRGLPMNRNSDVYFFRMRSICESNLQKRAKAVSPLRSATALQDASAESLEDFP